MTTIVPQYKHDCDCCEFHGQVTTHNTLFDVYYCPRSEGGSVIARFGRDGDYLSMATDILRTVDLSADRPIFKAQELINARKRAQRHNKKLSSLAPFI